MAKVDFFNIVFCCILLVNIPLMSSFLVNSKPSILLAERRAMAQDEKSREGMLNQLQVRFACDEVDADEISELLLEVGTLSVSVEVEAMKDVLNDEAKWSDLQKQKSWDRALLRCNFPQSFDHKEIVSVIRDSFPKVNFDFNIEEIENKDWISHVQVILKHPIACYTVFIHIHI